MRVKNRWLYVVAFMLLAVPIVLTASHAVAVYIGDGAVQNATTGGWDLPTDAGVCITGIKSDGTIVSDNTIHSRPDCIAKTFPAYTSSATCKTSDKAPGLDVEGAHFWANTCVDGSGNGISLSGFDRTAAMCGAKGGTWGSACTSSWSYWGPSGNGTDGFCYTRVRLNSYNVGDCPINTFGYTWDTTNGCLYAYGRAGYANAAITKMDGTANVAAGIFIDLTTATYDTMGECLFNGASWSNHVTWDGTTATVGTNPLDSTIAASANITGVRAGCLTCHNNTTQHNSYAERWKSSYLKTGHKNMLRKVTAGANWAGPDGVVYSVDASGHSIDFVNGTVSVGGINKPLWYLFGDWMAPLPNAIYDNTGAGVVLTDSGGSYSCAACHATGWRNEDTTKGVCSKSSKTTQAACTTASGIWYPSSGAQGYGVGGAEPLASFPQYTSGITGQWDIDGIVCTRCHAVTYIQGAPLNSDGYPSAPGHTTHETELGGGEGHTNICFGCHQSLATDYVTNDKILDPAQIPTGAGHGANWGREFNGHVIGNEFLNSPHAFFNGTVVPNSLGKYDIVVADGSYNSPFAESICRSGTSATGSILSTNADGSKIRTGAECTAVGGTWWAGQIQGSCTTCHDVHQSLVPAVGADEPMKRECIDCHTDRADLTKINHPAGAGTPLEHGTFSCEVCHMPKPTAEGLPAHLFRISTDPNYDTFPSQSAWQGGICSINPFNAEGYAINSTEAACTTAGGTWTAATKDRRAKTSPDLSYPKAVWVDLDLACGQCHGGSAGRDAVKYGAPWFSKTVLATDAANIHLHTGYIAKPVASMTLDATDRDLVKKGIQVYVGDTITVTDTSTDLNGDLSTITVSWGDKTVDTIAPGGTITHAYSIKRKAAKITLTATDSTGRSSKTKATVKVLPVPAG